MLFLAGWLTLVYFAFVHMVWSGGLLAQWRRRCDCLATGVVCYPTMGLENIGGFSLE